METTGTALSERRGLLNRIPAIPLAFLGLGIYRAWIEITFVGSFVSYPAVQVTSRDLFDITAAITMLAVILMAKRIGPFFNKRAAYWISGISMTASTVMLFASIAFPQAAWMLGNPSALLGGFGIALTILLWSELYGCLNPLRVALYYSASIVAGALILYIYRGFQLPWLFVMSGLLPLASLICVRKGFGTLPEAELPSTSWVRFSAPWKVILLMSIYAFAYGMMEDPLYSGAFGPHSAPGAVIVASIVCLGVVLQGGKFDFNIIYRIALPMMIGALLLIPALGFSGDLVSNLCVSGGYTAFSILTMLICSNICYRYGVSAIWLFGIERGVRFVFMFLGREVTQIGKASVFGSIDGDIVVSGLTVIAVVMGTFILLSEHELASRWGASFLEGGGDNTAIVRKQEIADRCNELVRRFGLTARESEVLLLLAQKKTVGIIERELFIANGTAKAHIRHIYQKLDIHSREELFDMLGIDGLQPVAGTRQSAREEV
jgi:DNA-binding CsgD family transcriptional regulator